MSVHSATDAADELVREGRVSSFLRLVKIEHSIFALPFALCGAMLARVIA